MSDILSLFPENYEASRERFRDNLTVIQKYWPQAELSQHKIAGDEDLTIDWISSNALDKNEKVFILTTAEHGIEGYVGSAMQQRFIDNYLSRLDSRTTGLLLVHAINPWGMKYHRRVNAHNVDLNRNFIWDASFNPAFNPEYDMLRKSCEPTKPILNFALSNMAFYANLLFLLAKQGVADLRKTFLVGQYRNPQGLHYGSKDYEEETRTLINLYRQAFSAYDQILHLDMHTGYGPRYQMSIVNSALETGTSNSFAGKFNYPIVVAANPEEFYAIQGDMIDFEYALHQKEFPEKKLFATAFEFGTLGNKLSGVIGSPRTMIFENRLHWNGSGNDKLHARIKNDFEELFNPTAADWRIKSIADADRAFEGILTAEGYIQ